MQSSESKLKEIYHKVLNLTHSDDSVLDIMNYLEDAINIAKSENPDRYNNPCLNNLMQTREKQLERVKNNFSDEENIESYFNELKYNLISDITHFGFTKYPFQ